jgi:hypothetical protein
MYHGRGYHQVIEENCRAGLLWLYKTPFHFIPTLCSTDNRGDGDEHNLIQTIFTGTLDTSAG